MDLTVVEVHLMLQLLMVSACISHNAVIAMHGTCKTRRRYATNKSIHWIEGYIEFFMVTSLHLRVRGSCWFSVCTRPTKPTTLVENRPNCDWGWNNCLTETRLKNHCESLCSRRSRCGRSCSHWIVIQGRRGWWPDENEDQKWYHPWFWGCSLAGLMM